MTLPKTLCFVAARDIGEGWLISAYGKKRPVASCDQVATRSDDRPSCAGSMAEYVCIRSINAERVCEAVADKRHRRPFGTSISR